MSRHYDENRGRRDRTEPRQDRSVPGYGRHQDDYRPADVPLETHTGKVDWYNPNKGYGFVKLESPPDAYLSAAVLSAAGYDTLMPGTTVVVSVRGGDRRNVARIESVDASTATELPRKPGRQAEETVTATLKWFDPAKGYGFLAADGFDVFLHVKVVERSGIGELEEGVAYRVGISQGDRGKIAVTVERD